MTNVSDSMLTQQMKDWFGVGEYDVDLMLRMGVLKEQTIIDLWYMDCCSPGYDCNYKLSEERGS